jgi:DHA2 family multidrug resistance protein-like MFS transporter
MPPPVEQHDDEALTAALRAGDERAFAVGAAFVQRQRRLANPMIDLSLFRRPAFSAALGANTLAFAVVFGVEVFVAQYLQLVLGLSPLRPGYGAFPLPPGSSSARS